MSSAKPISPYKHADGSNCWTKNCRRNQPRVERVRPEGNYGLSPYMTEQIGISAEAAIATAFNVPMEDGYRARGVNDIALAIAPAIKDAMDEAKVPLPSEHTAAFGNPVDFMLANGQTLSVKTNMRDGSMIAPQIIGQPSAAVFWSKFPELVTAEKVAGLTYEEQSRLFKAAAMTNTAHMLTKYWKHLFDCDYLVYANNILEKDNSINPNPFVKIYTKAQVPQFKPSHITYTKSLADWNESNTVKYDGVSIGEWQVHSSRDCFKFRFNLKGLHKAELI